MALPPLNFAPSTELDAVNVLLMSIGQAPVNSLAIPGVKDVSIAQLTLHNVSRDVQARGLWFNTDTAYPILRDVNGNVAIPAAAMQVEFDDSSIVQRANKAYDTVKRSFVFDSGRNVTATIKWFYQFSDLPQVARSYILLRAGRVFQTNIVASQLLYQFTKEQEIEALAELDRANLAAQKLNFFNSAAASNRIVNRR